MSPALLLLGGFLSGAQGQELTLTDMNGRSVALSRPAERIVALPLPASSTLIAADRSADRLLGLHPIASRIMAAGPLGRLFPELASRETALLQSGGAAFLPNVEALAALEPDLVVQRGELGEDIVRPLEEAGLETLLVSYGDENRTRANIRLLGQAIGQAERGEALVSWREAVESRLAGLTPATAAGVLFLSRSSGAFQTTGWGTPNDHAIRLAGGRNLAGDMPGSVQLGIEQILALDPDVIVLNSGDPELTPAALKADSVLSTLKAVRENRVYKAPTGGYRLEPPSPENPLYWLWLAAILRPGDGGFLDIPAEFVEGFRRTYGADATPGEIAAMLQTGANAESATYGRIAPAP